MASTTSFIVVACPLGINDTYRTPPHAAHLSSRRADAMERREEADTRDARRGDIAYCESPGVPVFAGTPIAQYFASG
jgi:hypothetical protein